MSDLKLIIKFDIKGKNEIDQILAEISKKHNLTVNSNLGELHSQIKTLESSASSVATNIGNIFSNLGFVIQGVKQVISVVKEFIGSFIKPAAEFETIRVRLVSLYQDADKASKVFEHFKRVAETTPFDLLGVANAGAQLKAFGMNAEEAIKPIADLAAYMGVDVVEAANSVGRAWAGGAGAAIMLRDRGILELIRSFKGIDDLTKLTLPEFRQAMMDTFVDPAAGIANATDLLSNTYAGAVANMEDAWTSFMAAMGSKVTPVVELAIRSFTGMLEEVSLLDDGISDLSRRYNEQKFELQSLISIYFEYRDKQNKTNVEIKRYEEIISLLQAKYPDFIGKLNLHKSTQQEIQKAVADTNAAMEEAYRLQMQEAYSAKAKVKVEEEYARLAAREVRLQKLLQKRADKLKEIEDIPAWSPGKYYQQWGPLKDIENSIKDMEHLIIDSKNVIEKAEKEYQDAIDRYNELRPKKDQEDIVVPGIVQQVVQQEGSIADAKDIDKQLEVLRRGLLEKDKLLQEDYESNKAMIEANVANNEERIAMLSNLERKYQADVMKMKNDAFNEELELFSKQKELGIMSYDGLKMKVDDYYKWASEMYSSDSREYIQALNLMRNTNLRYGQEKKDQAQKDAKELYDTLQEEITLYRLGYAAAKDVTEAAKKYQDQLFLLDLPIGDLFEKFDQLNHLTDETLQPKQFGEKLKEMADTVRWFGDSTTPVLVNISNIIQGSFGPVLSEVIVNHKSFSKQITQVWRNLRIAIIQQIEAILVKMLLLRVAGAITGNPIGWAGAFSSSVQGFAEGGHFKGEGGAKEDKNLVLLSNGEYIVNTERTNMFKPLLDLINFAPLNRLNVPSFPAIPQVAYASGGRVSGSISFSSLENKLDKVVDRLERIERKDYNVSVNTKFKGVEFAREMEKANQEYKRRM